LEATPSCLRLDNPTTSAGTKIKALIPRSGNESMVIAR
jgi:hypothetical protein